MPVYLVIFQLDYCNRFYVGLPLNSMWKLQFFQNAFFKICVGIFGTSQCAHITLFLCELPMSSNELLGVILGVVVTHKVLHGSELNYSTCRIA